MSSSSRVSTARRVVGFAVAGLVAAGAPLALAGTASAAPSAPTKAPAASTSSATWEKLAECESSGNWKANTGNGFSGGLQFTPSTWKAFGGSGKAHQASKAEQIKVAKKVQAAQGWNAWPSCSSKIGLG